MTSERAAGKYSEKDEMLRQQQKLVRQVYGAYMTGKEVEPRVWQELAAAQARVEALEVPGLASSWPDSEALQKWADKLSDRENEVAVKEYRAHQAQRIAARQQLRRAHLINPLTNDLLNEYGIRYEVRRCGCEDTADFVSRLFRVSPTNDLLPDAPPQNRVWDIDSYGHLERDGNKGWNGYEGDGTCWIAAEAVSPYVVLVGEFIVDIPIPAGNFIFQATSTIEPFGGFLFFSEGVNQGTFSIQSHLWLEGDAADPVEIVGANRRSQTVLDFDFGTIGLLPPYGFFSSPNYSPYGPLAVDVSVLGPGTLRVREIINYYLFLNDYESGAFGGFAYFGGRFEELCWDLLRRIITVPEVVAVDTATG